MSAANDEQTFADITGANQEQAKFYLESAKGDVNAAVSMYFESGGSSNAASGPSNAIASDEPVPRSTSPILKKNVKGKTPSNRRGINTLGGLQQDESDQDDDEKPAEFYTGGEKSGLGVIDPTKKKDGSNRATNLIEELIRRATAGGQQQQQEEQAPAQTSSFRGSGYTLGSEDEDSRKVDDPNEKFRRAMAAEPETIKRVLRLWQDGFSVDDGQLYRYDDPANREWLEAINKGHAPLALLNVAYGQPVDVLVERRTDEPYRELPKPFKPFESSGHRLGSEAPPELSVASSSTTTTATPETSKPAEYVMQIDESKPVTSLQIRLASGARIVSQFNTHHTLADVYAFVEGHPQAGDRSFQLLSPFPRKEFERDGTTIEAAGLLKGVLQQKFTT